MAHLDAEPILVGIGGIVTEIYLAIVPGPFTMRKTREK